MQRTHTRRPSWSESLENRAARTVIAIIYLVVIVAFFVWFILTHLESYD